MNWLRLRELDVGDWVAVALFWLPAMAFVLPSFFETTWLVSPDPNWYRYALDYSVNTLWVVMLIGIVSLLGFLFELRCLEEWARFLLLSIVAAGFSWIGALMWSVLLMPLSGPEPSLRLYFYISDGLLVFGALLLRRLYWTLLCVWIAVPWYGLLLRALEDVWKWDSTAIAQLLATSGFLVGVALGLRRASQSLPRAGQVVEDV